GVMVTVAVAVSFELFPSVGLVTVAVFVTVIVAAVAFVAVATTVTVTLWPTATLPNAQLSGLLLLQLPLLGTADASVHAAGKFEVMVTAVAADGPAFVATSVNVTREPVATVCEGGFLVRLRSPEGNTVKHSVVEFEWLPGE